VILTVHGGSMARQINTKQQLFADAVILGVVSNTQAYIDAGYKAKNRHVAESCTTKLLRVPSVHKYIQSHRQNVSKKMKNTLEARIETAQGILEHCTASKTRDNKTALGANDQLIKLGGHYKPERVEIIDLTEAEARKRLAQIRGAIAIDPTYKVLPEPSGEVKTPQPDGSE